MLKIAKAELDSFLPKTAVWYKGLEIPTDAKEHLQTFGKLSKRKKLLALIGLTDPKNECFPGLMGSLFWNAGKFAWYALNWIVLDSKRVSTLLRNRHITLDARAAILAAQRAGRCVDELSKVFDAPDCQQASLVIAQHGSLKQRISLVKAMDASDAFRLVSGSDAAIVQECINWARSIDGK
jgi:hypothetical protein